METPSGPVFVLLRSADSGHDLVGAITRALTPDIAWNANGSFWEAMHRLSSAGNGAAKGELPRAEWPIMVRFRDLGDPKSVEKVDPNAIGVKRIGLETTTDPMTTGIEKRLGWLGTDQLTLGNNGQMGSPMAGSYLNNSAFWNGNTK